MEDLEQHVGVSKNTTKDERKEREEEKKTNNCSTSPNAKSTETEKSNLLPQVIGTVVVALTQIDAGAIFSYPGVTLPQLLDEASDDIVFNTAQAAFFGSLVYLGAMVGSFLVGVPMVRLGQRVTLLLALPLSFVSWIALTFAPSVWMLLSVRVLQGFALSFTVNSSSTYVAEIAHSSIRGRLVTILDICRQIGGLLIYCLGISSLTWRQVALTTAFVNLILPFIGLLLLPNSPRWLATRNRNDDARQALRFFRGDNYDVDTELETITNQLQKSFTEKMDVVKQLQELRQPTILRYVLVMSVVLSLLHFNGTSIMPAYVVIIMNSAHVQMSSYVAAIAVAATKTVGTVFYAFIIDRIDRKPLFTITSLICALSMSILGGFFFDRSYGNHLQKLEWLPVLCLAIYSFASVSPLINLLRSELFPTAVRSTVVPILYTTFFIGAFLSLQTYPYIVAGLGSHGAFWLFSGCSLVLMLIVGLTIPETRGKTLEQIAEMHHRTARST